MPLIRYRVRVWRRSHHTGRGFFMARASATAGESCARVVSTPSAAWRVWRRWAGMRARARQAMSYAGPIAAALMLLVMAGGVAWRLERSRLASLDEAAHVLDLRAS